MDESTSALARKLRGYPDSFGDDELEELRDLIDGVLTGREFFNYPAGKHIVQYKKEVEIDEAGKVTVNFDREDRAVSLMAKCLAESEARLASQQKITIKEAAPWTAPNLDGAPNLGAIRDRLEALGYENINVESAPNMAAVNRAIRGE